MRSESLFKTITAAAIGAALIGFIVPSSGFGASQDEQEAYNMTMKQEIEALREKVASLEGDSAVEQAWEEAAGDWGRLQLATDQQWQDAKAEFEESWEALEATLEEAVQ
jgi:hypothetical protein